jgi:hypothetical protein
MIISAPSASSLLTLRELKPWEKECVNMFALCTAYFSAQDDSISAVSLENTVLS